MELYTIGFSKKTLRDFIQRLQKNRVKKLIDVRLNNTSQLAGYAKKEDLEYVLELVGIKYEHYPQLAPTERILKDFKNKRITWDEYEKLFMELLKMREPHEDFINGQKGNICLLCSEDKPNECHRRLIAEYFLEKQGDFLIKHL